MGDDPVSQTHDRGGSQSRLKYDVFVSYRRVQPDRAFARQLANSLETYRLPNAIAKRLGRDRLRGVFFDDHELPAGGDLPAALKEALRDARFLALVCTPRTPNGPVLAQEITFFRGLDRGANLLPVLFEGEPAAAFPPEILAHAQPAAADVRVSGWFTWYRRRRRLSRERLRLLAPLFKVSLGELQERDAARRRLRWMTIGFVLALIGAAIAWVTAGKIAAEDQALSEQGLRLSFSSQTPGNEVENLLASLDLATRALQRHRAIPTSITEALAAATGTAAHPLRTFRLHRDLIGQVRISADDSRLLTTGGDKSVVLFDSVTGSELHRWSFPKQPGMAVFSPDGKSIAIPVEGVIRFYAFDGSPLREIARDGVQYGKVEFSPTGEMLALSAGNAVELRTAGGVVSTRVEHDAAVQDFAFSSDGKYLVTGAGNIAKLCEIKPGKACRILKAHQDTVRAVRFSPDGTLVATAAMDDAVFLWSSETGAQVAPPVVHEGGVTGVAFSHDGSRLVTTSFDGTARISRLFRVPGRGANSFQRARTVAVLRGPRRTMRQGGSVYEHIIVDAVRAVAVSADDSFAVTAHDDGSVTIWRMAPGNTTLVTQPEGQWVRRAALTPNGQKFIAMEDGKVRFWSRDGHRGRTIDDLAVYPMPPLFTADGTRVVFAGQGKDLGAEVDVLDVAGETLSSKVALKRIARVADFGWRDQEMVFLVLDGFSLTVWDTMKGAQTGEIPVSNDRLTRAAHLLGTSGAVLTMDVGGVLAVWDRDGKRLAERADAQAAQVIVSSDGNAALTQANDLALSVWSLPDLRFIGRIHPHDDGIISLAVHPRGESAISIGLDGKTVLWSMKSRLTIAELRGHGGPPRSAVFSHDGSKILTVGDDRTLRLWDGQTGAPLAVLTGAELDPLDAAFSPDDREILVGGQDRVARFYPADLDGFRRLACQLLSGAAEARARPYCATLGAVTK
jgi:WD40 repeat protein